MSQSQIGSLTVSDDNYDKKSTEEDIYPNRKKESSTSAGHESTQTIADVGYEKESEGNPITKKHYSGEKHKHSKSRKRFRTQDSGEIYDSQENVDISEELGSNVTIVTKINYSEEQPSDGASSAPNNDYGKTRFTDLAILVHR